MKKLSRKTTALLLALLLALAAMPVLFGPAFAMARGKGDKVKCEQEQVGIGGLIGNVNVVNLSCVLVVNRSFNRVINVEVDDVLNDAEILNFENALLNLLNICSPMGASKTAIDGCIDVELIDIIVELLEELDLEILNLEELLDLDLLG